MKIRPEMRCFQVITILIAVFQILCQNFTFFLVFGSPIISRLTSTCGTSVYNEVPLMTPWGNKNGMPKLWNIPITIMYLREHSCAY